MVMMVKISDFLFNNVTHVTSRDEFMLFAKVGNCYARNSCALVEALFLVHMQMSFMPVQSVYPYSFCESRDRV